MTNLPIILHQTLAQARCLIAVSGGVDSMVLWHYWHTKGYAHGVVHCNFGLRAHESDEDEAFVRQVATQRNTPFWGKRFDTKNYAQTEHLSLQEAARLLRYAYFEELRREQGFDYILTAHHADDQLETVLYHLIKGTSLTGLRGMKPQNGYVVRPLLQTTRNQMLEYARWHQLTWREDSSNQTDRYARNFIRNHLIPLGRQLNPAWETTFIRTSEKLASAENIVAQYIRDFQNKYVAYHHQNISINKQGLLNTVEPTLVLYETLKTFGFHYDQLRRLTEQPNTKTGKRLFSPTHVLYVDREVWQVSPISTLQEIQVWIQPTDTQLIVGNHAFEFQIKDVSLYKKEKNNSVAYFDKSKLQFPLLIRPWRHADRMKVLGLKGSKKISDILTDAKVSPAEKSNTFVLVSGQEIIWLIGFRTSETAKVTPHTSEIYQVVYHKNHEN